MSKKLIPKKKPQDSEPVYYDFIEPATVKAFNSQEEYNRYYGEKFGRQVAEGMNDAAPYVLQAAMLPFDIAGAVELPMLLYRGVKAAPTIYKMGKHAIQAGKKKLGKKVFGMVDDINSFYKADSHFRVVDKPAIDDAIKNKVIRSKTGLHHDTVTFLKDNFSPQLKEIPNWENKTAEELIEILDSKGAFNNIPGGKRTALIEIRNSTNHGGAVHYMKGAVYPNYPATLENYVIETPHSSNFVAGHGGREYNMPLGEFGVSLLKTNGSVKNASIPTKGSRYWKYSPFWEMWKSTKFNKGGKINKPDLA